MLKCEWNNIMGILPMAFFHMPLQEWLRRNATAVTIILPHQLPWRIYFPFLLLESMVSSE